jgi:hypothetical protein
VSKVQRLERLSLEPVLQLDPHHYERREREAPERYGHAEWDDYWRICLADSGLVDLVNLRLGSWQVPVRGLLRQDVLSIILGIEMGPLSALRMEKDPILVGGFALLSEGKPVIEAQSCGDLSSLESWADLAAHEEAAWKSFWIGHPQLPARRVEGWLELAKPKVEGPFTPLWSVRPEELRAAVNAALAELQRFSSRVLSVLKASPELDRIEDLALNLSGMGGGTRWAQPR